MQCLEPNLALEPRSPPIDYPKYGYYPSRAIPPKKSSAHNPYSTETIIPIPKHKRALDRKQPHLTMDLVSHQLIDRTKPS